MIEQGGARIALVPININGTLKQLLQPFSKLTQSKESASDPGSQRKTPDVQVGPVVVD